MQLPIWDHTEPYQPWIERSTNIGPIPKCQVMHSGSERWEKNGKSLITTVECWHWMNVVLLKHLISFLKHHTIQCCLNSLGDFEGLIGPHLQLYGESERMYELRTACRRTKQAINHAYPDKRFGIILVPCRRSFDVLKMQQQAGGGTRSGKTSQIDVPGTRQWLQRSSQNSFLPRLHARPDATPSGNGTRSKLKGSAASAEACWDFSSLPPLSASATEPGWHPRLST